MQLTRMSSGRGGTFVKLFVFLAIFGAVVTAAWIFFMPLLLTSTLEKRTGFKVKVDHLVFNPFAARVDVSGLLITNPSSFPRADYVDVRHFEAQAPARSFFSDRPEFDLVRIDVAQIAFVRTSGGTLNAALFYDRLFPVDKPAVEPEDKDKPKKPTRAPARGQAPSPTPEPPRFKPKPMPFHVRRLELKIDRVTIDDRLTKDPVQREYALKIDQTFTDVTNTSQLMTPALLRAIAPAATSIGGLIPGDLGQVLSAAATPATDKPVKDELKSIADTLEETRKP